MTANLDNNPNRGSRYKGRPTSRVSTVRIVRQASPNMVVAPVAPATLTTPIIPAIKKPIQPIQPTKPVSDPVRARARGQALIIVALVMTVLILFVGLGVDVGNLMGKKSKLQSAVDSAALSGAQLLAGGTTITQTAALRANQILEANNVLSNTLTNNAGTISFPGPSQIRVQATQHVQTFFMRIIPAWGTVDISADATADLNSYAEINAKPYGKPGIVNELNLSVWGVNSWRSGGDAYSPQNIGGNGAGTPTPNPYYSQQPYGYLYRIDVPSDFPSSHLVVQIFDPDSYNKTGTPTPYATCTVPPTVGPGTPTPVPTVCTLPTLDMYASCSNPRPDPPGGGCSSNGANQDPGIKLNAFPNGLPAFWRVDELRTPWNVGLAISGAYNSAYATNTRYTLWHFDPTITSAFADPATLSDQPGASAVATYTVGWDSSTDLSWYQPPGFAIDLQDASGNDLFAREDNGGFYFYLYVQGIGGSSENNFDLRVGPSEGNDQCTTPCSVNQTYFDAGALQPTWDTGGASIFAKKSMVLNLDTGDHFPMVFTQVSKNAAGQQLGVRHFDQDCTPSCNYGMVYQMQKCGCNDLNDDNCWENMGVGFVGPNNRWTDGDQVNHPDPEPVNIPNETDANYPDFFGANGECQTSWMRLKSDPSYSNDTTVWELPFVRPRLIK